jgi:hypothetical protein
MKLEKGIQERSPEAIAIAKYEEENPEHRNKVACATQDDKGNWTFTLVGGEVKPLKATRTRKTVTQEAVVELPWREVVCHIGQRPGNMADHTLEQIFVTGKMAPKDETKLAKLVGWFVTQALPTSSKPADQALWKAVQVAEAEIRAGFVETPTSTSVTPEQEKPAQQPPALSGWRDFVIPGKHPDYANRKLGDLGAEGVKRLSNEYLTQIDWDKATLPQKSLKAHVAMAMAELFPAKAEPELELQPQGESKLDTASLKEMIRINGWDSGFFITQCKLNQWVSESVRKIEDIDEQELFQLGEEWAAVEREMQKAHHGNPVK